MSDTSATDIALALAIFMALYFVCQGDPDLWDLFHDHLMEQLKGATP